MNYRLYVDESGNHQLPRKVIPHEQYLCLLGCMVENRYYQDEFVPQLKAIKRRFFSDDPDTPVILHREDLVQRNGQFSVLSDPVIRRQFNREMVQFYRDTHCYLLAVVIDKQSHITRNGDGARHPYHYCVESLLERYCLMLRRLGGTGDVMVENRGRIEDELLCAEFSSLMENGTRFADSRRLRQHISHPELHVREKAHNIPGLQMADLLAYSAKFDVLEEYGIGLKCKDVIRPHVSSAITDKYDRCPKSGRVRGFGKKLLK